MPYKIEKRDDEYCVIRPKDGNRPKRTFGCHDTREEAQQQLRALEANTEDSADAASWYRFVTNKAKPKTAEVYIYGDIGDTFFGDGVTAQAFIDELNSIDADALDVRINSPGGSAWDGLAIANAIIRHKATVTTWIDGLAASAASLVAVAGDEVVVSKYGQAMLHNARAMVMGTAKDMREVASQLDNLNTSMASYYADRAGGDASEWARAMSKESWYNADEMLAAGLVTRIDDSAVREEVEQAVASAMANTAEQYRYPGRPAAPAPVVRAIPRTKEIRMSAKDELAKRLGKESADVTDDDLFAAALEAIGEDPERPIEQPAETVPPVQSNDPKPAAAPEALPAAASAKDGIVQLDQATYDQLRQQAQLGAKAHATLQAQADARVVDAAIDTGRIQLARRDHYMALMAKDRDDTTKLLTTVLQPGAAVSLTETGHCADTNPVAAVTEDPRFKAWKVS